MAIKEWKCKSCFKENTLNTKYCDHCGCPKTSNYYITTGWKQQLEHQHGEPTWGWKGFTSTDITSFLPRTVQCPGCNLHVYITARKCTHCNKIFSLSERHSLIESYKKNQNFGITLGLVIFPVVILIAIGFVYAKSNF